MSAVSTMQAAGHENLMISAASYPPLRQAQGGLLQEAQERGTHSFEMGIRKTKPDRPGHPSTGDVRET